MNELVIHGQDNVAAYRASTDAAELCREIVVATATTIQNRKYVCVEGWQAIAVAHGCTASARAVERVDGGVRAIGQIRRMHDGAIIAEAEGFVGEDEPTWYGGEQSTKYGTKTLQKRPDYAIRAMAQTRAISRACRSAFAHVVVMMNAGLSTTPAEEVPVGWFDNIQDAEVVEDKPRQQGKRHDPEKLDDAQLSHIQVLLERAGMDLKRFCDAYKISAVRFLPASKFGPACDRLKEIIAEKQESQQRDEVLDDEIPY